jgi:hypothetical protein
MTDPKQDLLHDAVTVLMREWGRAIEAIAQQPIRAAYLVVAAITLTTAYDAVASVVLGAVFDISPGEVAAFNGAVGGVVSTAMVFAVLTAGAGVAVYSYRLLTFRSEGDPT